MKAEVISDAHVLTPNLQHQNFTRTGEIIKPGTKLEGEIKIVKGLKRGQPFDYNLFYINNNDKIIYIKNIKPMDKTEVTLGADAANTPTIVREPGESNLGFKPLAGVAVGALIAHYICRKKGLTTGKHVTYVVIGGLIGFAAGKYWQSKSPVAVKKST